MPDQNQSLLNYFSRKEKMLWAASVLLIISAFFIFDKENYLTLTASLLGATSLIFNAKGNPLGQILIILFSIIYGYIAYSFDYYGEMITYLGMTTPMAFIALASWLKNPFEGNRSEVEVNQLRGREIPFMFALTTAVTVLFYFILSALDTSNLIPSTISVFTSFIAAYLTFRRSPFYAVAYACNDITLIVLWSLATMTDISYFSVIICFGVFLINDIYGFISWRKIKKRQKEYLNYSTEN